jgi:hypothetical protein
MCNGYIISNYGFSLLVGAMNNGAILNVGVITDGNRMYISPYHCIKPNGAVVSHCYLAYHYAIVSKKTVTAPLRRKSPDCFDNRHVI